MIEPRPWIPPLQIQMVNFFRQPAYLSVESQLDFGTGPADSCDLHMSSRVSVQTIPPTSTNYVSLEMFCLFQF